MRYRKLGNTGLTVSCLTLGTMTFGNSEFAGFRARVDQEGADRMVGLALDAGVNTFDTADMYSMGQSEEVLGAALKRAGRRGRAVVATKVAFPLGDDPNDGGLSYRHVIAGAEASLRRLDTDYIDLYQLHSADFDTPLEETLRALENLVERGLVRYIGWSNLPAWYAAKAFQMQHEHNYAPFASAQIYYNLLGRDVEREILPMVRADKLGTFIWSPLAGGFLSGKYTREDPTGGGGRLAEFRFPPISPEHGYETVDLLRRVAGDHGITVAQAALGWLLAKEEVTSILIGANNTEQLKNNLAAAEVTLDPQAVAELDALHPPTMNYPQYMYAGTSRVD